MVKREDSIRSLGQVLIATDKPTRAKLKAAAAAHCMPLTEYLRVVADKGLEGMQGVLPDNYAPSPITRALNMVAGVNARIDTLSNRLALILLDSMTFKPQNELQVRNALSLLSLLGSKEYAERRRTELESYLVEHTKVETKGQHQVALELGYGTYE